MFVVLLIYVYIYIYIHNEGSTLLKLACGYYCGEIYKQDTPNICLDRRGHYKLMRRMCCSLRNLISLSTNTRKVVLNFLSLSYLVCESAHQTLMMLTYVNKFKNKANMIN